MFYGKRNQDQLIENILESTEVYSCSDDTCIGWMRKDFATADLMCPMCGKETTSEMRDLPKI